MHVTKIKLTSRKRATDADDLFIYHLKALVQSCLVKIRALVKANVRIGLE